MIQRIRSERGQSVVEFALVAPILFFVILALVDFGRAVNYWLDATHLANQGARLAAVNNNPCTAGGLAVTICPSGTGTTLQAYIRNQAETNDLRNGGSTSVASPAQVCIAFPDGAATTGHAVKVTVTANYNWASVSLPLFGTIVGGVFPIKGSSTMRLETDANVYASGC